MKKKHISDEKMRQLIKLRKKGTSWTIIGDKIDIKRRVAKRAYEEWEQKSLLEELKEVRREIAGEDFRKHRAQILELAGDLVERLDTPAVPTFRDSAEVYLAPLWKKNRWVKTENEQIQVTGSISADDATMRRIERQNDLLFGALKAHTKRRLRWNKYDEWQSSWDACKEAVDKFRGKMHRRLKEDLDRQSEVEGKPGEPVPDSELEEVTDVIITTIWRSLLDNRPGMLLLDQSGIEPGRDSITVGLRGFDQTIRIPWIRQESSTTLVVGINEELKGLYQAGVVSRIADNLSRMQTISSVFEKVLNPLVLGPIILTSRCDLCPV